MHNIYLLTPCIEMETTKYTNNEIIALRIIQFQIISRIIKHNADSNKMMS